MTEVAEVTEGNVAVLNEIEAETEIEAARPCGPGDVCISDWPYVRGFLASSGWQPEKLVRLRRLPGYGWSHLGRGLEP